MYKRQMVAMGEDGKPTEVPPLDFKADKQKQRYIAAKVRRELRKEHDLREEIHDKWISNTEHMTEEQINVEFEKYRQS